MFPVMFIEIVFDWPKLSYKNKTFLVETVAIPKCKVLSIEVILLFDLTSSLILVYDCNPKKKCESGYEGRKVADPEDCFSYYLCLEDSEGNYFPSDNTIRCNQGYFFNAYTSNCNAGSTCENQCVNLCLEDCTSYTYEKVADFKDCSSFYLCSPGRIKTHHKCPSTTPYFDGSECSEESYVCCDCCDECTPYCKDTNLEIADPYDCRSYYLCLIEGFPTNDYRYTCKEGEYFDASLGRCEVESEWNSCKIHIKANITVDHIIPNVDGLNVMGNVYLIRDDLHSF
ncbi:hypothetical protein Avbf_16668 [Armadillidium vulgare]|nr:hypothetical protein Avbf_16668 [Armadillidium vulgare]